VNVRKHKPGPRRTDQVHRFPNNLAVLYSDQTDSACARGIRIGRLEIEGHETIGY